MDINRAFLQAVTEIVQEAGVIVERIAQSGFETQYKERLDPVTTADHAANDYLKEKLSALLPEAGWLSEETRDNAERLAKQYVWIVDPIDGTKEFVQRVPQYAVSVALAKNGQAVLGVVYNPATAECFAGLPGQGAWLNETAMKAEFPTAEKLTILGSRSEIKRGEFQPFEDRLQVEPVGSIAYKLALIAAGRANATFSLGPKNEWDIAAGVALVDAAGGRVTDISGTEFEFNHKDTLRYGLLAATTADCPVLFAMIRE